MRGVRREILTTRFSSVLDTRAYDRSITSLRWNNDHIGEDLSNDASRTLMGGRQEKWFYRQLSESSERGATWRVVGNQILFAHRNQSGIDEGSAAFPSSPDEWDGYVANRNRTLKHIVDHGIDNTIMLAGDSHASEFPLSSYRPSETDGPHAPSLKLLAVIKTTAFPIPDVQKPQIGSPTSTTHP